MVAALKWFVGKVKEYIINFSEKDLVYIILVVGLLIITLYRGCGNKPSIAISKPALVPTVQKKDKSGTTYTEVTGTIYTEAQMKHVTDSFKKELKKGIVAQVINTVTPPVHDTVPVPVYVDSFNHILSAADSNKNRKIAFTGNWATKKGTFHLDIAPDTATYVNTWKHRLFRPDVLTANIYHTNDLYRPSFGNVYTSKTPKAIVDFDWFVGYDPFLKRIVTAPGIGLHIFSIKRKN